MPVIYRASVSYLVRHPWQLVLAVTGIVAGVAVMVAIDLANNSSRTAFRLSMDAVNGRTTHQVVGGPRGVAESVYTDLRVDHGWRNIAPVVSGYLSVADESLQLLGVDIFAEQGFRTYSSVSDAVQDQQESDTVDPVTITREFLTTPGALILAESTAKRLGLVIGDQFAIVVAGQKQKAVLAGIFGGDDAALANIAVGDIAQTQEWLDMVGYLTRIDVILEDVSEAAALELDLNGNVQLLKADARTEATAAMSDAFTTNLQAMSLLALLVGIFLIYNSVAFAVLQRRALFGTLRALGVTRWQVIRLILLEAVALGIVGSLIGVAFGALLGKELVVLVSQTISDHYFVANVTDILVDPATVIKGFVAGIGATLVAGLVPAIEAGMTRPRLAMLRSIVERRTHGLLPYLVLAGLTLIVFAALLLRISGTSLVAGLVAVFAVILGIALLIPVFVKYAARWIEPVARRIGGTSASIATSGISLSLSRTGVAIVALSIAVSATIGVNVMVESFRQSVGDWLGDTLQSDIYVGVPRGSLDPAVIRDITSLPSIDEFSSSRRVWLESERGRTRIIALQMAAGSYDGIELRSDDAGSVWRQFVSEEAVLVSDAFAYKRAVAAGDSLELRTNAGAHDFTVAGIYRSYDSNDGSVMMSRVTYDLYFGDPAVDSIGLYLAAGYDAESVMDQLREVSTGRQSLIMNSNAKIREMSLQIFDRTFVITNVLYWLAVGVALVGILGAMLALQMERAHEFGVLRAVGMTPWQVGGLVTGQSGLMGLMSGIAAIPLGIVMAVLLIEVINRRAFGWQMDIFVSLPGLGAALLLAVAAAICAGIYPAILAARSRPALAMREE